MNMRASHTNEHGQARFTHRYIRASGIRFHIVEGGTGPLVVLVAGFPQSCYAWRKIMPLLASDYSVVAVDLPGQGDSEKPPGGYDTRTAAQRLRSLVQTLGHDSYFLVGHDIGSWVAYPYAHQFESEVRGLVVLDANIPGVTLRPTVEFGPNNWRNWHFLFNSIPDLPEALLQGKERVLIEWFFSHKTANLSATFSSSDIDEYERVYRSLGGLRGMLGYYRAIEEDMEQNKALFGRKLTTPVLALGGDAGSAPDIFDSMRHLGQDVRGGLIKNCGHYIPEEQPEALAQEMMAFFRSL